MRSWNHCGNPLICAGLVAAAVWLVFEAAPCQGTDTFDVVSGVLESSLFKGKKPLEKLELAAELVRTNKLKQSDLSFVLLDWADQYLREPPDPTERLQRWAALTSDEKLGSLRIPRDFLNRILLAEHLVARTSYLEVSPRERLELLGKLEQKKLVDWSVFLAYGRLYAGGIAIRARKYEKTTPVESLAILKDLKDDGLIDWHYKVPTEAILAAEALAIDKEYQKDPPARRLAKLRDMETSGLISAITKRELEKLPAWRLLETDTSFLKSNPRVKAKRLRDLQSKGLITPPTSSDLVTIFVPSTAEATVESKPSPIPEKMPSTRK